jgi:regulator of protease activity HflC (stomatin/prohibitin superfamily)
MKNRMWLLLATAILFSSFTGCAIIRGGEVGVKQTLGKVKPVPLQPGVHGVFPFTTRVYRLPTRTVNLAMTLSLPAKEGVSVIADISILYRIDSSEAANVFANIGINYEENLIISVFRSSASDVTAQYMAKDMHSGNRALIEEEIAKLMNKYVRHKGFIIENVLMKSISLPKGLSDAIEMKMRAEQEAQRMAFELDREKSEAERKRIEAEGTREAYKIVNEGLTDRILRWQGMEAFLELAKSPNAKVIITDGNSPSLVNPID